MKTLIVAVCLSSVIVANTPSVAKADGLPKKVNISASEEEVLNCQTMSAKYTFSLKQDRDDSEFGVVYVWSRQHESAKYPDIIGGNFDYPKNKTLADRIDFDLFAINLDGSAVFNKKTDTLKVRVPSKGFTDEIDLQKNCNYSINSL